MNDCGKMQNGRRGFTLIELLLVVGIIAILASIVIVAVNPGKQLKASLDAKRVTTANQMQKALYQYLIDTGRYPATIPEGESNARPICKKNVDPGVGSCLSFDLLPTTYLADLPVDAAEPAASSVTGYKASLTVGRRTILPVCLGLAVSSSSLAASVVSSAAPASSSVSSSISSVSSSVSSSIASSSSSAAVSFSASSISGLVARWQFEEGTGTTTADTSGNNYTGTLVNNPTWSTTVPTTNFTNTRAISFDGINDYVSTADIDVNTITISAWVKANTVTTDYVVVKNFNGTNLPYSLHVGGSYSPTQLDGMGFFAGFGPGWANSGVTTDIRGDGQYHHIAGTYDGTTLKYYVDGVLRGSSLEGSGNLPQNNNVVDIGVYRTDNAYFSGLIDDVRIYNRALTLAEIGVLAAGN